MKLNKWQKIGILSIPIVIGIIMIVREMRSGSDTKVLPSVGGNSNENIDVNNLPSRVKTKSGTRLRQEPNTNSTIVKTFPAGVVVGVVSSSSESDGLWYKVESGSDTGWMRSDVVNVV